MNCDVCNENLKDESGKLKDESGKANAGVVINLLGANPAKKRVEEIFGKSQFRICHVCWLKSLGVKTKETR
jgi:hypothetical protein